MLIEVLTRCYKRPKYLAANQASLDAQTDDDWQQTLLVDEVGRGVEWANRNLGRYGQHLDGDYIWILDDDDVCTRDTLFIECRRIIEAHSPDVIMLRGEIDGQVLPDDERWQQPPQKARIGMSNFIVRREVWAKYAYAFPYALCADYSFISTVYAGTPVAKMYWHDVVAFKTQRVSRGKPE